MGYNGRQNKDMTTESLSTWHRISSILAETSFGVNKTMKILKLLRESESILEFKEILKEIMSSGWWEAMLW